MELNYTVKFANEGLKRLRKLDSKIARKVTEKAEMLGNFRSLNTIKKMEGYGKDFYRMRVGDVRIIFRVTEENKTVWVVDMGFRGGVYR